MTFTNSSIRNIALALTAVLFAATLIAVAPTAQAADMDFGGYDYYDGGYDYGGGYDYYDGGYDDYGYDYYDGGYDDYGYDYYDGGYDDYGYDDYGYDDYSYPGGSSGGFGGGSFGGGSGWTLPPSMPPSGGNMQSQNQSQGQAQSQSSTNTNVNQNVNNINISVPQAQPTVAQPVCPLGTTGFYPNCVYPQPTYDICPNIQGIQSTLPAGYVIQYGNCQYQTYTPPVYPTPAPQPYVTLSQLPYTGLELGPLGTALYWGFLVLWCLIAAYLIAVKKVQNKVASWFTSSTPSHTTHTVHAVHAPAKIATPVAVSGIDPFIASQIHRAK